MSDGDGYPNNGSQEEALLEHDDEAEDNSRHRIQLELRDSSSHASESAPSAIVCQEVDEALDAMLDSLCVECGQMCDNMPAVHSDCSSSDDSAGPSPADSAGSAISAASMSSRHYQVNFPHHPSVITCALFFDSFTKKWSCCSSLLQVVLVVSGVKQVYLYSEAHYTDLI